MKKGVDEFDFKKNGRTIDKVGRKEQNAALDYLLGFLTNYLAGKTQEGCFSEEALGCPAVLYFASIAMSRVFGGFWTWKEETKLTTLLCNAALSRMGQWERDWKKKKEKGQLEPPPVSYLAFPEKLLDKLEADEDDEMDEEARTAADEKEDEERKMGFEEAKEAVKDDPVLVKYVKAVQELDDYHKIDKRMKMTKAQREETEARLIERLVEYRKSHKKPPREQARVVGMQ